MSTIMLNNSLKVQEKVKFEIVTDLMALLPIMERRLPKSCFMYNQLKSYESFKQDLKVYSLQPSENEDLDDLWILFSFFREDWGSTISISAPVFPIPNIPSRVQEALQATDPVDWTKRFCVLNVDLAISDFIAKTSLRKFGNVIKIFPCDLYYMELEEALKINIDISSTPEVSLGPLSPLEGTQFLTRNWQYTKEGTDTFIRKSIENHISAGVYVRDEKNKSKRELACVAISPGYGVISSLVTHPNHRRKGYASLVMKYICKQLAANGFYPSWDVEISDPTAVAFHKSLNKQVAGKVDYISHKAL
ncbi:unnamed protein product [Orchesella dallaii]|uniref:N-acetyltransferase domain-containing protein n=1 Tax=Orchesella dallaii TaxID=48710 RepID=A0ABP1QGS1_9HEXA